MVNSRVIYILMIFIPFLTFSQDDFSRKGTLKGQLTISAGKSIELESSIFYLHGNLEYYTDNRISFSGDIFHSIPPSLSYGEKAFQTQHSMLFGAYYHINKSRNDLYFGMQSGLSYVSEAIYGPFFIIPNKYITPILSPVLGYNLFVSKYFNFFIQGRYMVGHYMRDSQIHTNDFRFSAGLGFQLPTKG